ncbi:MAG: ParB/Srx family N-terminal domain-containing protein [Firmicutes bacterium]|nr:ParB/Srx family N-terminal domain-containing protein [Bacillota bacterium]
MDSKYEIKTVRLSELKPHPKNPRVHPDALITKLANSIREFGFTNPVLIDQDNRILAGHARCKAAEKMELETVPAIVLPLSGAAADAYVIVDNKLNELSSWDENLLCSMLTDLENGGFDLAMTGFDADEVDALFNAFYSKEAIEDDFDVDKEHTAIEAKGSVIQSGDIVLLGRHRLMCGDSTRAEDFSKLMEGCRAQAAVTSPPYGVGKEYEKKGIEPWFELIKPAIKNITKYADVVCWNLGDLYATGSQFIEPTTAHSIALFIPPPNSSSLIGLLPGLPSKIACSTGLRFLPAPVLAPPHPIWLPLLVNLNFLKKCLLFIYQDEFGVLPQNSASYEKRLYIA